MTDGPAEDGTGEGGAREGADEAADRDTAHVRESDDADVEGSEVEGGDRQVATATDAGSERGASGPATDGSAESATDASTDTAADDAGPSASAATDATGDGQSTAADVPDDVRKYDKFKKIDGGTYDRANEFLRDRTYVTAREWAIARLCADFRTETGVEMTKIGENLPELVPFMTDTYTPQAVNQARASFEEKVRKSGATFLYGAMCDFFTAEELDDVMYEATEVAKFLLEVEGVELSVDEELEAEDRISEVMREVREHSAALRHDEMTCPECGHEMDVEE